MKTSDKNNRINTLLLSQKHLEFTPICSTHAPQKRVHAVTPKVI